MNRNITQSGFGHVALVLVVLVFGAIGAIGYTLYANPKVPKQEAVVQPTVRNDVPDAPEIKTAADLDRAISALNQVDPEASSRADESSLSSQANAL